MPINDIFSGLQAFHRYERNGLSLELSFFSGSTLPPDVAAAALALTKQHMQALYDECPGWGWKEKEKWREMTAEEARYIVARHRQDPEAAQLKDQKEQSPGALIGFLHFRYEQEHGEPTAYIYEIQVCKRAQGKGLGKYLMQLLELTARKHGVTQLMLTVFTANTSGWALYKKLGFALDMNSPGAIDPQEGSR
jgi:ribosomal protein S18 acetylase RimI-like enzyme